MKLQVRHCILCLLCLSAFTLDTKSQTFTLDIRTDSMAYLVLHDSISHEVLSRWRLPYPTYGFCTGDVNRDGSLDALVGVVKPTRFNPVMARRLFVFKQVEGRIRPLWLGSKLGPYIEDFRFVDGCVRCLHRTDEDKYSVVDYRWGSFGPSDATVLAEDIGKEEATNIFGAEGGRR